MQAANTENTGRFASRLHYVLVLLCTLGLLSLNVARADDFIVYSPHVTNGQSEVEFRGDMFRDSNPAMDGERNYQVSVAHAITSWWRPEVYLGEYENVPGQRQQFVGNEFENVFQLTGQGEYWADVGFCIFRRIVNSHSG